MTPLTAHKRALELVEAAAGPDRELDLELTKLFRECDPSAWYDAKDDLLHWHEFHDYGSTIAAEPLCHPLMAYTASLDAVIALVEREAGKDHARLLIEQTVTSIKDVRHLEMSTSEWLCSKVLELWLRARIAKMEQETVG